MNVNKTFIITFFFVICGLVIIQATFEKQIPSPQLQKNEQEKKFSSLRFGELIAPKIFHLKNEVPTIFLSADFARIDLISGNVDLEKPGGKSYNLERGPINYIAQKGHYNKRNSELELDGEVSIEENGSTLKAEKVKYRFNKDEVFGEGDVSLKGIVPKSKDVIFINALKFSHFPKRKITSFKENVEGRIVRREAYREGINFQTDFLDYYSQELRINLTGSVLFRRKPFSASSRSGQIHLNNHNKLNYFVLNDDVKLDEIIEEKGRRITRKAFAEKMEGFPDEGKLILTGYPRVFQENEIIKGIRITVRENSNVVEVEEANTTLKLQKGSDGKNLFDSN